MEERSGQTPLQRETISRASQKGEDCPPCEVCHGSFPKFSHCTLSFEGGEPPPLHLAQRSLTLGLPQNPWRSLPLQGRLANYADFWPPVSLILLMSGKTQESVFSPVSWMISYY